MTITPTVCFPDLDKGSEVIIFELILTTFITSIIFRVCFTDLGMLNLLLVVRF